MERSAVVTVLGQDRTGIVAAVAQALAQEHTNIDDISQSIVGDMFTMTLLVTLPEDPTAFSQLRARLATCEEELHVQINLQMSAVFDYMHRI